MRREGSALHGVGVVMLKELSDHLSSVRMRVIEWLVVLVALVALYFAIQQIRDVTAEDPFLFLRLFTTSRDPLPSFVTFLTFLVPLIAIGLGFDAINGEHNRRTLSRILAQPIYRDALLFGKFLAGLFTLSISLIALWVLVIGLGLFLLGVPPNTEEMLRAMVFLFIVIAYAGVWLVLAMLFSIIFRSTASAALVTLGLWLFLTLIWPGLAQALATGVLAGAQRGNRDPHRAGSVADLARRAVQRGLSGDPQSVDALARTDLSQPAAGCGHRRAAAAVGEPPDRLAADRRPGGRGDPGVRRRLYHLPAPGSARLEHDPEKWETGFRKRSCSNKKLEPNSDSTKGDRALAALRNLKTPGAPLAAPLNVSLVNSGQTTSTATILWLRGSTITIWSSTMKYM